MDKRRMQGYACADAWDDTGYCVKHLQVHPYLSEQESGSATDTRTGWQTLCGDHWQAANPTEYLPNVAREGTCEVCGDGMPGLVYGMRRDPTRQSRGSGGWRTSSAGDGAPDTHEYGPDGLPIG